MRNCHKNNRIVHLRLNGSCGLHNLGGKAAATAVERGKTGGYADPPPTQFGEFRTDKRVKNDSEQNR